MGVVIAIVNQKGGVGKTTTAVNLSASLSAVDKACLLIDCDPQGNATTGLGFDRKHIGKGLYDLLTAPGHEGEAVMATALPKLYLMAATSHLIGAEVEIAAMPHKEYLLRERLSAVRAGFDYVFLDCPPSLGYLTVNALTASDAVLVPLQCEYYALEGLSQLLHTIRAVKQTLNPTLAIAGILLTMYDPRNNLSQQVAEEVRGHFGESVLQTVIPRNVRLSEAPSHGKPILLYDIRCKGAQSYLELAQELIKKGIADNGKKKGARQGTGGPDTGGREPRGH